MTDEAPRILVATDRSDDADLVCRLLEDAYPVVERSTDPGRYSDDFDLHRPQVLIIAFRQLEAVERYYLGLYRTSTIIRELPHRTLILCATEEAASAYALCCKGHFDDYVLFWPPVDACRLPMSVRLALRALAATHGWRIGAPESAEYWPLAPVGPAVPQWLDGLKSGWSPPIEAAKKPTRVVLVVDDDVFMRGLLSQVLTTAGYEVDAASSVAEMMEALRGRRADLIVMDVMLPGVDGIMGTRTLKALPVYAEIPVIMLTGQKTRESVVDSLRAGAVDYVVKPFNRASFLKKVERRIEG